MIKIEKGKEPAGWTAYRRTPGACYDAIPELREALLREQGYLCAYCMQRIPAAGADAKETTRIEHIHSRSKYPAEQLDYRNMVICCPGVTDGQTHCDKRKANEDISFSLFTDAAFATLSYSTRSGELHSSDTHIQHDIDKTLNLNHDRLKSNRREVLAATIQYLTQKSFAASEVKRQLTRWQSRDKEGRLRPYYGVIIWFLQKQLRKAGQR